LFEDDGVDCAALVDADWTCDLKEESTCSDDAIIDTEGMVSMTGNIISIDTDLPADDAVGYYCIKCTHNTDATVI